ncbi:MAG: hypothetical protein H0T85_09410 [Geodermatophilaceae bacterium]|nr:hypothetical protein [Geodermatophilaceae bacterium]
MVVAILLFTLGGFLAGAAWAARGRSVLLAVALAVCSVLAVVGAFLRYE